MMETHRAKEYRMKQPDLEIGQSVEMGTIHTGDLMGFFSPKIQDSTFCHFYKLFRVYIPCCQEMHISMVVSILSASFVSDAPFLASRWQSIDINPTFNWICSGNLCSIFEWLIMMLKLFMKLSQHQNSSIQGSYMFLTTTSIFVRQALMPLVALSNYQLKKFYCNFRQIIHTD